MFWNPFSRQKPAILRVHPEIAGLLADGMDIRTVSQWRATCRESYVHASASLRRTLTVRLRRFVPHPASLVDAVTKHGAVFGGEVALSFMLRPAVYYTDSLEIFVGSSQYNNLCDVILDDPDLQRQIDKHSFVQCTLFDTLRRQIAESLIVHLSNGMTLYVHQSYTCSPTAPISRSFCTALSNFVNGYGFGCSHPSLTLNKRALLADQALAYMSTLESETFNRLLAYNYSLCVSPTAWPEYRRHILNDTLRSPQVCWRGRFTCPNQGRYFGDKGSLIGFFDPLGGDEEECMTKNFAPYGPMVIWRIMTTFECDDDCNFVDEILEADVFSVPVLFKKDPFGLLRDCVSEQCLRSSTLYRRFRRPRSMSV